MVGDWALLHLPFDPHILMHLAALVSFAALAFRDQLKLRAVLLVSIALSMLYHLSGVVPAWQELFWNTVTFAVTLKVLVQIVMDRTHLGLTEEDEELFAAWAALTPGEFRALLKVGARKTAAETVVLTRESEIPDKLYYVLSGALDVDKAGRKIAVPAKTFIGEVAFLRRTPATATVTLEPGARYVEWPVSALQRRHGRHALQTTVHRLIGLDMAVKVGRS